MILKVTEEHFQDIDLKGWVEIELPNPIERMQLAGKVSLDGADLASTIKQAENLAVIAMERIKAIDLVHVSGKCFKSMDEISQYNLCNRLLYAIGGLIINGMPLGKN